jgi:hypothetical protein
MTMILDGHTTIEHSLPVTPLRKDVVTLYGQSATAYTPTLLVAYGGPSGDLWFHQHYELWKDERLQRYVPQAVVDTLGRIPWAATARCRAWARTGSSGASSRAG